MNKYIFPISIGLTAVILAAMAAFFSVTGLGKIFLGWPIFVMAGAIELGKLMAVSILYRLWGRLKWWKYILIPMTILIMMLTSAGIYGFLSASYEHTASGIRSSGSKIELEEKRKQGMEGRIKVYQESINRRQERANSLAGLRYQQENRMDSLYARNQIRNAKSVQAIIIETDKEISRLNRESDSLNTLIENTHLNIAQTDSSIVAMNDELGKGDIGALKYLSRITGASMDNVANIFMVAIMLVFDPLAIILIVAFNIAWDKAKEKTKDESHVLQAKEEEPAEQAEEPQAILAPISSDIDQEEDMTTEPKAHPEPELEKEAASNDIDVEEPIVEESQVYATNENGDFVKMDKGASDSQMSKLDLYLSLLKVLYQDGQLRQHDHIDAYDRFTGSIVHAGIKCSLEQVDDFLKQCVIWKIIKIGNTERVVLKPYDEAVADIKSKVRE